MSLDLSSPNHIPLNVRIAEFREDPQNMDEMREFIDDILKKAQIEADVRFEQSNKVSFASPFGKNKSYEIVINIHVFVFLFSQTEIKKNGKGKTEFQFFPIFF